MSEEKKNEELETILTETEQEFEHEFDAEEDDFFEDVVTVIDEETGKPFDFYIACNFDYKEELYYVLVSLDDEEPVALFAKKLAFPGGEIGFQTVDEDEFDEVAAEYERLCSEMEEDEESEEDTASICTHDHDGCDHDHGGCDHDHDSH